MELTSFLIIIISIIIFAALDWGVKKAVHSKDYDSRIITQFRVFFIIWYLFISYLGTKNILQPSENPLSAFIYFILGIFLVSFILSITKIGEAISQLEWSQVVGFQGIKILIELTLYIAYMENLAPIHSTFYGLNLSILSGVMALLLGFSLKNRSRLGLVKLWNFISIVFSLIFIALVLLAVPSQYQIFKDLPNTLWMSTVPYIYILGIFLFFTLFGHWIVLKKIKSYDY